MFTVLNNAIFSVRKIFYGWWIVVACIFLSLFLTSITNYSFTTFVEPIANEFLWSYTQTSIAASLRMMEVGIMSPYNG